MLCAKSSNYHKALTGRPSCKSRLLFLPLKLVPVAVRIRHLPVRHRHAAGIVVRIALQVGIIVVLGKHGPYIAQVVNTILSYGSQQTHLLISILVKNHDTTAVAPLLLFGTAQAQHFGFA